MIMFKSSFPKSNFSSLHAGLKFVLSSRKYNFFFYSDRTKSKVFSIRFEYKKNILILQKMLN